jgi:ABC-type transport system involved in Fe-S cluster assembly fused permease/ATPase subunit
MYDPDNGRVLIDG